MVGPSTPSTCASVASTGCRPSASCARFAPRLEHARELALDTVRWVAGFDFPDHEWLGELVSLAPSRASTRSRGAGSSRRSGSTSARRSSSTTWSRSTSSTRRRCTPGCVDRGEYLLGPLARFALNADELSPVASDAATAAGLSAWRAQPLPIDRRPRGRGAARVRRGAPAIIDRYREPDRPAVEVAARAGVGYGWTEAPRGMLWHRYELDADGLDHSAPGSSRRPRRTRPRIERDLFHFVEQHLDLDDDELGRRAEQVIRSYDPCISCATHFLDLTVDRA